ncbi:hypothetical protein KY289_033022 [Solanum tuberosum]|nr:hypothetical protein KY289_033022 [Solanum tuberosum]
MSSMQCDKRPRDETVERVNDPQKFMIMDKTPPLLMDWWNDMHQFRRTEIFKHLDFLTDIMSNFELTPTLKKLGGFIGLGKDLRSNTLIAPRSVSGNKFLEQMHIIHPHMECFDNIWVSLEFLHLIYGRKEGFFRLRKTTQESARPPYLGKA